jgi:hypothetical protein
LRLDIIRIPAWITRVLQFCAGRHARAIGSAAGERAKHVKMGDWRRFGVEGNHGASAWRFVGQQSPIFHRGTEGPEVAVCQHTLAWGKGAASAGCD